MTTDSCSSAMLSSSSENCCKKRKISARFESMPTDNKNIIHLVEDEMKMLNHLHNQQKKKRLPFYHQIKHESIVRPLQLIARQLYRNAELTQVLTTIQSHTFAIDPNKDTIDHLEPHRKELIQMLDNKHHFLSRFREHKQSVFIKPVTNDTLSQTLRIRLNEQLTKNDSLHRELTAAIQLNNQLSESNNTLQYVNQELRDRVCKWDQYYEELATNYNDNILSTDNLNLTTKNLQTQLDQQSLALQSTRNECFQLEEKLSVKQLHTR